MTEKNRVQKPLAEQILDATFEDISGKNLFDKIALSNLKELAKKGDLKNANKVADAIRVHKAGRDESS